MKVLKGILKFIINSVMVCAICLLVFNITGKKVFYDLLYSNLFEPVVIEETKAFTNTEATSEEISKVLENKNVEKIISDYVDSTMNDLASDEVSDTDIGELFVGFIKENKDVLEKELDVTITDEDLDKVKESDEYKQIVAEYKAGIEKSKSELTPKEKKALKTYNYGVSSNFRYLLIGIIVLCIALLGLIEKSLYKWIKPTSINTITSGVMTLATALIVQFIVDKATLNMTIKFSTQPITNVSLITIGIGIVLLIIYIVINKKINKEKESEVNV